MKSRAGESEFDADEFDFQAQVEQGLRFIKDKRWTPAYQLFLQLNEKKPRDSRVKQYLPLTKEKSQQEIAHRAEIERTITEIRGLLDRGKWEEAIIAANLIRRNHYDDFALEKELRELQAELLRAENVKIVQALEDADGIYNSGSLDRARIQYQKILHWDPTNMTARSRLNEIELRKTAIEREKYKLMRPGTSARDYIFTRKALLIAGLLIVSSTVAVILFRPPEKMVMWRANRLVESQQKAEAVRLLSAHLEKNPTSVQGMRLYNQLTVHPQADKIKQLLAEAREKRDNRDYIGAVEVYRSVLSIDPENPDAKGELTYVTGLQSGLLQRMIDAQKSYDGKSFEKAWEQINEVLIVAPDVPDALKLREQIRRELISDRYKRARALYSRKQYHQAVPLLEEALRLDVSNLKVRELLKNARNKIGKS